MPNDLTKKQAYIILAALTAVGCFLRFYKLDFQSLWYDELHSIVPTHPNASVSSIIEYSKGDQPPAFFVYLHLFFKIFGYSEYTGRAAAAVIGVLSIPAIYILGKECKNRFVGIAAASFVAVNYFSIYYSQELRFYSFAFLFSILSFLFFIRAFKYGKSIDYVAYVIVSATLLYTHYFGMVIFATQCLTFIALAILIKAPATFLVKGLAAGTATGLAFSPWLPIVLSDLGIGAFWIQRPKALFLAEYFYGYLGKDLVAALLLTFLLVLFFKNLRSEINNGQSKAIVIILLLWLALSYAIPLIRSIASVPILHIRYTIVTLPAWFILAAWGLNFLKDRLKITVAGLIILSSVANLFLMRKHYSKIAKQQFREAAATVIEKNVNGLPVMTTFPWHYSYYFMNSRIKPDPVMVVNDSVTTFWLMPVQTFSRQEMEDEINSFSQFEIKERYSFHNTEAILMVRK